MTSYYPPSTYRQIHQTPSTSSDTELDSPLLDYPVSPTDPTMDIDHIHINTSPGSTNNTGVSRAPSNSPFFNNVFLDPGMVEKGTKPLKVKKRLDKEWVAPVGPPRIRRRSTHSLPRSPISPIMPTHLQIPHSPRYLTRDNSTSSSAHRAITSSFLALESPLLTAPLTPVDEDPQSRNNRSASADSGIHLGLGRFLAYDPAILPGPSPPTSPPLTPKSYHLTKYSDKSTKPLPASPVTPTRAPSKAAKLLGTNSPLPSALKSTSSSKSISNLLRSSNTPSTGKNKHYRPLPNSTLVDIQRFFGEVPKKSRTPVKKGILKNHGSRAKVTATSMALRSEDKVRLEMGMSKGGEGTYELEGRMWLDVEEEQEFAWLMSDLTVDLAPEQRAKVERAAGWGVTNEGDWGMAEFRCVLDMKKVRAEQSAKKIKKILGEEGKKEKSSGGGRKVYESFLDLGIEEEDLTSTKPPPRLSIDNVRPEPSKRSITNPTLIIPKPTRPTRSQGQIPRSISAPLGPHYHPYPVFTSPNAPQSDSIPPVPVLNIIPTSTPSRSSSRSPPSPPDRPKHRPPPLDLRYLPPIRNMPIVISTTPRPTSTQLTSSLPVIMGEHVRSRSVDSPGLPSGKDNTFVNYGKEDKDRTEKVEVSKAPRTPFKYPRGEPIIPTSNPPIPSLPTYTAPQPMLSHRPAAPAPTHVTDSGGGSKHQESVRDYIEWYTAKKEEYERKISVFDPPSPTILTTKGVKVGFGNSGKWFKRVVKL